MHVPNFLMFKFDSIDYIQFVKIHLFILFYLHFKELWDGARHSNEGDKGDHYLGSLRRADYSPFHGMADTDVTLDGESDRQENRDVGGHVGQHSPVGKPMHIHRVPRSKHKR